MTFAMPVKMIWVEATRKWHMEFAGCHLWEISEEDKDLTPYNCMFVARKFPGLDKNKENNYIIKITRVEAGGG